MTGFRESQLLDAVNLLLDARRTSTPLAALPAEIIPTSPAEYIFIQDHIAEAYGPIGGWKVGAPSLDATPGACPLPAAWIRPSGATVTSRFCGLEAEIAFLLRSDLPPRSELYSDQEVYAAVASCHPAIEVLDSGLIDPTLPDLKMSQLADLQMHGGLIFGAAVPDWQAIDFHAEHVTLAVEGVVRVEATGSNTSGDLLRLLPWLANAGAARTGGLYAGQWITTGSWTGASTAISGSAVDVHFANAGKVSLCFAQGVESEVRNK